jgi:transcriptional regulator with XRE-family HTH domain
MGRTLRSPGHLALMGALKKARIASEFTQAQLADLLHRPQSFVAKYENGERKIEVVEFVQITEALEASGSEILELVKKAELSK